ncbi:PilN domain-containing protein [Alistipes sp. OttesenSCG-928-B03]|nr:PilN domain-containing protein [Alistipes sp. OttesenSCG-928-B03]
MNIIRKILPRVSVLTVTFSDGENYRLRLVACRSGKEDVSAESPTDVATVDDIRKELTAFPVLVLVGGYGVITKQADTAGDIVTKVTAPESGFRWTRNANDLSFVRGEQLVQLENALGGVKAKVVEVQCAPFAKDAAEEALTQTAVEYAGRYFAESVNLRKLLKPSAGGSALAWLTAARLKLPVLAVVLLALVINAMTGGGVRSQYENAERELQALRKTIGQADDATRRQREFIREYDRTLPRRISWMCDRAGMVLPDGITLTALAVQPPLRSIENNKKTTFAQDVVEIEGEARNSADVSQYVTALNGLDFASQVCLASMEQDRDSGRINFKITLEL